MKLPFKEIVDNLIEEFTESVNNVFCETLEKEECAGEILNILVSAHISSLMFCIKKIASESEDEDANNYGLKKQVDDFCEGILSYLEKFGFINVGYMN